MSSYAQRRSCGRSRRHGPGDIYGYSNHPKRTVSPRKVACNHLLGHCSFGMVTVTVSVPGDRVLPKEYGVCRFDIRIDGDQLDKLHINVFRCQFCFEVLLLSRSSACQVKGMKTIQPS